jgi:MSHA biogenesis protein MshL
MEISKKYLLKHITIIICVVTALISGCKTVQHSTVPTSMDQMQNILAQSAHNDRVLAERAKYVPRSVSDALMPSVNREGNTGDADQFSERRYDVAADKVPAKTFFGGLVEGTSYNMVVNPNVEGDISLNLKNVTVEEAMDAVRDMYGYQYRKTTYGYEVTPAEMETQIFTINYLNVKRSGKSNTETSSGQVDTVGTISVGGSSNNGSSNTPTASVGSTASAVSSTSVNTISETDFWVSLDKTLKTMLPIAQGRSISLNAQSGVVIVHAFPIELHRIGRFLARMQSNLQRQIIIEAKVLEVNLNNEFESGVDWSLFGNPLNGQSTFNQSGNGPDFNLGAPGSGAFASTNIPSFDPIFTINVKGSFRTLVNFLQTQGNVQTLSSPRISTVNNQPAVIKVGQDQFFVTGVSTTNTLIGTNTLPSQNVSLTPFFSGVSLDVTPQINKNGTVILHIHPIVSVVTEQQQTINLGSSGGILTLPLALSTVRETDSIVRAKNGQVVVIGGLMQNSMAENMAGTPFLSRIPFIGALFRRTSQIATKSELVILLRPIIVDNKIYADDLERTNRGFQRLKKDFHIGGYPDTFGDEGEVTDRNPG